MVLLIGCRAYDYQLGAQGSPGGGGQEGGRGGASLTSESGGFVGGSGGALAGTTAGGSGGRTSTVSVTPGLVGWASVSECGSKGTTGGDAGPTVRPSTAEELDDAVRSTGPMIIEISGSIELGEVIPQILWRQDTHWSR
ncbi:MAG: hypothetical protein QM784_10650 [Polyangiaceae bacterium]